MDFSQIKIKNVPTYTATIYSGFKKRYSNSLSPGDIEYKQYLVNQTCKEYCDKVGLCVSVKFINYLYTNGGEPGVEVGLINYPRFPSSERKIYEQAVELANLLMIQLDQLRVTVVCPDITKMVSSKDAPED